MNPKEFEAALKEAEVELNRLKHLYDLWFQGFERLEPTIVRKNFDRDLHRLRRVKIRRAALRFRFQTLTQRYTTLQTYWRRVARQIEEGTYRRDLMKVRRKREARRDQLTNKKPDASETLQNLDLDLDDKTGPYRDLDAPAPTPQRNRRAERKRVSSRPPAQPVRKQREYFDDPLPMPNAGGRTAADDLFPGMGGPQRAAPAKAAEPTPDRPSKVPPREPTKSSGPGEARLRQLYEAYIREKKKNHESVDNVDYEKVAKRIKKIVPKIEREHKGKQVDFEVVVKDGRVGLKPIVKK